MSHRSIYSYSAQNTSRESNIFKARAAKLKKYLMDLSGTSALKQALATHNIFLTNNSEFLQFASKQKHRVKVDVVMQWLKFDSIGSKDQITATMVIPPTFDTLNKPITPQLKIKEYMTPQPPSREKPKAYAHSRTNSDPLNLIQNGPFIQQLDFPPSRGHNNTQASYKAQGRRHRPMSVGGQKNDFDQLKATPLKPSIDPNAGPVIPSQYIGSRGRSHHLNRSFYNLNASLPGSCTSIKNNSVDNDERAVSESPQKGDLKSSRGRMIRDESRLATRFEKNNAIPDWVENLAYEDYVLQLYYIWLHLNNNPRIHDLQKRQAQYEYVFQMLKVAMKLVQTNQTQTLSREEYEEGSAFLQPMIGADLHRRIVEIGIDKRGRISPEQLSIFVDRFKYAPYVVKHFKNSSEQFQQIALFGPKIQENKQKVEINCKLLGQKIEEKFLKMGKAYRFFDLDKSGFVELPQFKHGLDLLGMRLPDVEIKDLFDHLDRKNDGILDFDEFCDLLEDRRIVKGVKAKHNMISENEKPVSINRRNYLLICSKKPLRGSTNFSPYIPMIYSDIKESPKIIDYRKEENNPGPEFISSEQKAYISRNPSFTKALVGSVKKFYTTSQPCRMDPDMIHGVKSHPSELMKDIMSNSFQKEWIEKAQVREAKKMQEEERRKSRPKKFFNDATMLRNDFIKKIFERLHKDDSENAWKMSRFSKVGSKVSTFRRQNNLKSVLNNSLNHSQSQADDIHNMSMI